MALTKNNKKGPRFTSEDLCKRRKMMNITEKYKRTLEEFCSQLHEKVKNTEFESFFDAVYSTINFDVRINVKHLEFYENALREEIEFLSDSDLESSIAILHSINEKVTLLQTTIVDLQISIYSVKYV